MNFRKTLFVLPNLFTLSSVFCGFFSLTLSLGASGAVGSPNLYQAALAICFGFFFDTFDGRVARLTKTQTQLGLQLDSLSDVITFGVAPAALIYKWGLSELGPATGVIHPIGLLLCWIFVCAGAFRLARFNVLTQRETKPGKFIIGLPIPAAAAVLVALVVVNVTAGGGHIETRQSSIGALVLALSYLMVSRVRFRSFKDFRLTRRSLALVLLLIGAAAAVWVELRTAFVFLFLISAYVALGLSEEIIFYRRRRAEDRAEKAEKVLSAQRAREAEEDEEVLRELGAYDNEAEPEPGPPAGATSATKS